VQAIVAKLGYSEEEVCNYVKTDRNSFVGVLYQKFLDDQHDKSEMLKRSQMFKNVSTASGDHSISAKMPI
jgi:hypothetical protein